MWNVVWRTGSAQRTNWAVVPLAMVASGCLVAWGCGAGEDLEAEGADLSEHAATVGTYEAENYTFQNGCAKATTHAGYTGTGFVDFGGNGTLLEWNHINAPSAGLYTLVFRYANGSAGNRQGAITVNDTTNAGNVTFGKTGAWTTWATDSIKVRLKQGKNKIRVTANTGSGGPNLDKMNVTSEGGTVTGGPCATANENGTATLSCPSGQVIKTIAFASYGTPSGTCPSFIKGTCHASSSQSLVESRCLNKQSCSVGANNSVFGDPCAGTGKKLAIAYSCGTGGSDSDGYKGSGEPLPLKSYMLNECDADEQQLLKSVGFTKLYRVSVDNWTNIATIQASPKVKQELVDAIGRELGRVLKPIKERHPDRLRKVLDFNKRTINVVVVYGSGYGWTGFMGDEGMFFKRNGVQGGGLHHEVGHVFDLHDSQPNVFRSHVDSIFSAEDAKIMDRYCGKTVDPAQNFIKADGTCAWSEFIAEQYHWVAFPDTREKVKTHLPEVYQVLLKYIPTPSSYVPFEGIPLYDLP